ncbi:MAG: PIN domain-containing protein [Acidobacteriota bacterium]
MKRVLIDVNVILDVLLNRKPHVGFASAVWAAVEEGRAEGLLSAHAVTTVHYLNARAAGERTARETTDALLSVFGIATVEEGVVRTANAFAWKDFEDAVTAAAAQRARCAAIITRNVKDFKGSPVRALSPAEAAAWLNAGG